MNTISQKGILHYPLCQYVFKLLLSTLICLYSNQYQIIISLLEKVYQTNLINALEFRKLLNVFLQQTEFLIIFINSHQYIPGYQLSTNDFEKIDMKVLKALDDYIEYEQNKKDNEKKKFNQEGINLSEKLNELEGRVSFKNMTINFEKIDEAEENLKLVSEDDELVMPKKVLY